MLSVDYTINEVTLYRAIEIAKDLQVDEKVFEGLSTVTRAKNELKTLLEAVEKIELEAKGLINNKAQALYGTDWQVIKGDKFKITRSKTGDMYLINGKAHSKFTKIKISPDSKAIDDYIVKNGTLPVGIEINDQRGESLRITIK